MEIDIRPKERVSFGRQNHPLDTEAQLLTPSGNWYNGSAQRTERIIMKSQDIAAFVNVT